MGLKKHISNVFRKSKILLIKTVFKDLQESSLEAKFEEMTQRVYYH